MGLFDIFSGISKQVNTVDIQRKKDEIDSLYNKMLTITDQLTETAKKIKDLKDQIKNSPSSDTKPEEVKKEEQSTETDTGKSEPINNNLEESEGREEEVTDEQPVAESPTTQPLIESPITQPAIKPAEMPAFGSTPSTDSLFGNRAPLSALPGTTPAAAMPPAMPGAMPPAMPGAMPPAMPGATPVTGATQQTSFGQPQNQDLGSIPIFDSSELGGGKKNRKNKTANTAPKRKRRTRRNKKVMAQAQAQTQGQAEGQAQGEASV